MPQFMTKLTFVIKGTRKKYLPHNMSFARDVKGKAQIHPSKAIIYREGKSNVNLLCL